jgi:hypothetical protein
MAIDYGSTEATGSFMPTGSKAQPSAGGFNFGDLTKMLGSPAVKNWLSSPSNQRMIADFGQALSMRNGKQGTGSMMAGAASNMINREQVGLAGKEQALRKQLYDQKRMAQMDEMLKLLAGRRQQPQAAAPTSRLSGENWGLGFDPEGI